MKPSFYQEHWSQFKDDPDPEALHHLATRIALSFEDRYFYNDHFEEEYIRLLCEMATHFEDKELNRSIASALFGIVVESLCDDFEELQTEAYNRVMSLIVTFCRNSGSGQELDEQLNKFGIENYQALYQRIEQIRADSVTQKHFPEHPRKILLLSRVTIGADVAITSVLVQRLGKMFPNAEIVVIGSGKLRSIFAENPRIRIQEVKYIRRGGLIERFNSWHGILEVIAPELASTGDGRCILVDPDSRYSQLGVLPLIDDQDYFFFNSRGRDSYPKKSSIAELTNHWLDLVLGEGEFCYPQVWLPQPHLDSATAFATGLRAAGCRQLISINFGVGGNIRKRISEKFERLLLLELLKDPATVILLDKGFGDDELERNSDLLSRIKESGCHAVDAQFSELADIKIGRAHV